MTTYNNLIQSAALIRRAMMTLHFAEPAWEMLQHAAARLEAQANQVMREGE